MRQSIYSASPPSVDAEMSWCYTDLATGTNLCSTSISFSAISAHEKALPLEHHRLAAVEDAREMRRLPLPCPAARGRRRLKTRNKNIPNQRVFQPLPSATSEAGSEAWTRSHPQRPGLLVSSKSGPCDATVRNHPLRPGDKSPRRRTGLAPPCESQTPGDNRLHSVGQQGRWD